MDVTNQNFLYLKAFAVWRLFRFLPVLSWSLCALSLGVGLAASSTEHGFLNWWHVALIALAGALLQGITAHAFNDREDWRSGTDLKSPGVLSGGTGVIRDGLLKEDSLSYIGLAGLLLPVAACVYFSILRGPLVFAFLLTGTWAGLAYTLPPFRLAYRPLLGEWLAAFPAIISCTLGCFFILTGYISLEAVSAGVLHGLFSLGWLMQHHLCDLFTDLNAKPPKITTPAFICKKWGPSGARLASVAYFTLAALWGGMGGAFLKPVFFLSVVPAMLCVYLAAITNPLNVGSITAREKGMIAITTSNGVLLSVLLGLGY